MTIAAAVPLAAITLTVDNVTAVLPVVGSFRVCKITPVFISYWIHKSPFLSPKVLERQLQYQVKDFTVWLLPK